MTKLLVCDCNRTMPLDAKALGVAMHTSLCRQEVGQFLTALDEPEPMIVACTQERALFSELAEQSAKPLGAPLRFVNIRELAGWTQEAKKSTPKILALLALAELPQADPVPVVEFQSQGRLLIIGPAEQALPWAEKLGASLDISVLSTEAGTLPLSRNFPIYSGVVSKLDGFLGQFTVAWNLINPIDPEMCTRCGACVNACPEDAIDASFQINLERCKSHRACVTACAGIGAIQFERSDTLRSGEFDLIMDLRPIPSMPMTQTPQGYLAPGADPFEQSLAAAKLLGLVGEFEKPKYFVYNEKICAHGRNGVTGCSACIDVCSTAAIQSVFKNGQGQVAVNPNLCMGCGACSTVCPSGAMRYNYPSVPYQGLQLKALSKTYATEIARVNLAASAPTLLLHSLDEGLQLLENLGRSAHLQAKTYEGLPSFVLPLGIENIASAGIDLWLGALSYGFAEVKILLTGNEDPAYCQALEQQAALGNAILQAYGLNTNSDATRISLIGAHAVNDLLTVSASFGLLRKRGALPALGPSATFALSNQKRETLEAVLAYFEKQAKTSLPLDGVVLPNPSLFGGLAINQAACTLCMSCVGSCPEGALLDNPDEPKLAFLEKQCVQCGLCVQTCPENALQLLPRLLSVEQRKQKVILNETSPFHCISCGKAFGTLKMVELMLGKLGTHEAFSGPAMNRLKMCSDCRVVDMMKADS
ncbi:MAG: 4Fe-4S binding protein [Burkholderiales bacterium]|nr:4Fe-4S binding protein [Burkholderiales bacterium]